jgi:hypothetical protein
VNDGITMTIVAKEKFSAVSCPHTWLCQLQANGDPMYFCIATDWDNKVMAKNGQRMSKAETGLRVSPHHERNYRNKNLRVPNST